ncbi:MAG: prolipoprotein diacylglyceryl transferase [Thermoanaerobaculia bacterium]
MRPVLFGVPWPGGGVVAMPAYGTFLVLGMLLAVVASRRHAGRLGLRPVEVFDLGLLLVASGVVAAHLLHVVLRFDLYRSATAGGTLLRIATVWNGGLVYYGGLLGATAALAVWARRRGVPVADAMDFVAPLGALGLASTRMGCFLNGCCFGRPSSLPWAVVYPPGSPAQSTQAAAGLVAAGARSLPIHPVQLYELAVAAVVFVWLWRRFPRRRFAGEIVALFCVAYGLWRLVAETLRADAVGWAPGGSRWTTMQSWSVLLVLLGVAGYAWAARRARPPWTAPRAAPLPAEPDRGHTPGSP